MADAPNDHSWLFRHKHRQLAQAYGYLAKYIILQVAGTACILITQVPTVHARRRHTARRLSQNALPETSRRPLPGELAPALADTAHT